jgi:predicted nucleotidyltransferase
MMHITMAEHQAIRQAITEVDPEATIYLFGSRANNNARGGDIDLLDSRVA